MAESVNGMDWNERTSLFFLEYVHPKREAYTNSGNLTFTTMMQAVKLLLSGGVFESAYDMKMQAMKDYAVILPDTLFE
jgi:hypothetical protein